MLCVTVTSQSHKSQVTITTPGNVRRITSYITKR